MLIFESMSFDNSSDFNDGSDFVIGYARALESLDEYLDKAMLDISCESSDNNDSSGVNRLRKIWDTIVNFFSSLLSKLKDFVKKYFKNTKSTNKEQSNQNNDPNKYTGQNSAKYQNNDSKTNNLGDLVYSWWDEVTDVIRANSLPKETIYKEIEEKYKKDYATLQKEGYVHTKRRIHHHITFMDDEEIDIVPSLNRLGEELGKLNDIKKFLLKLDTKTEDAASGKYVVHKINNLNKADFKRTLSDDEKNIIHDNSANHPIEFLVKLLNDSIKQNKKLSVSAIKSSLQRAVAFIRSQVHCIFSLIKHSVEYLSRLKNNHLNSKDQIFKIYKFPQDVKQEIANVIKSDTERQIAGKLPVTNLIVTSLDRYKRPNIFKPEFHMGATPLKGFKDDVGKGINVRGSNVYINYHLFTLPIITNRLAEIAGTIIHECGHVYYSASQKIVNGKRVYQHPHASNSKEYGDNYDNDPDENFANKQEARAKSNMRSVPKLTSWLRKIAEDLKNIARSQNNHAGA